MSLLGIDIGSSAVKAAVHRESGSVLARAREAVPSTHPQEGQWEVDADRVWEAVLRVVRRVARHEAVRRDPPTALAVSASGRESFPARADGTALGPCLRTADARRPQPNASDLLNLKPAQWVHACGHVPDHMDPANRLLWWSQQSPRTLARARWFLGWHELAALRFTGHPILDPALAAGFLVFDIPTGAWSRERLATLGLPGDLLPQVSPWATPVGPIRAKLADELGLPRTCVFVVGSFDSSCAAIGSGVVDSGGAFVAAGTWESIIAPVQNPDGRRAAIAGLAATPHPSVPGTALWARSPNGSAVVDWARTLTGTGIRGLDARLQASDQSPALVQVVPHLSGAPTPWPNALDNRGAILGLTLATTGFDIVKAVMEAIAFELAFSLAAVRRAGAQIEWCRIAGGGTRSRWWMQQKADSTGLVVEIPAQAEAGTLGAALLAGVGLGTFASLREAGARVAVGRRYMPDESRADEIGTLLASHESAVQTLLRLKEHQRRRGASR